MTTASTATSRPRPEALAAAVSGVLAERERFAAAARRRAVERFALADWLDRHAAIFAELVGQEERRAQVALDAAAERRGVERRPREVSVGERGADAPERAEQHAGGRARPVPVAAENPADAGAVPEPDRPQLIGRVALHRVRDDERRVVLDPRARAQRADHVLDLLARRPERPRAEPEPLVEGSDALDELAAEEDGERDHAVPEVARRRERQRPRSHEASERPVARDSAAGEAVQPAVVGETRRNTLQEIRRIGSSRRRGTPRDRR